MITREEAIDALIQLENSDILDDSIIEQVSEIRMCLEHERQGYHGWGADDDFDKLFVAYREDLWTDELKAECAEISKKYSFTPAPFEAEELKAFQNEYYGDDEESEEE